MSATLSNPVIPAGWTLVRPLIRHPRDGMFGDLVRNDTTGVCVHMAAGVVRSIHPRHVERLCRPVLDDSGNALGD